ncbi:MAG TPA: hypothetical protein VIU46_07005 [Gallionellaceae bacterium]
MTSTTTTTTAAPAPSAPLSETVAPAATPISATMGAGHGKGRDEGHEHGKGDGDDSYALSGTYSGDVLTVTSISHGRLKVGTKLSGMGLPGKGIVITEMLTGTGGVGTYRFKPL